jgi:hypothetical protein
VRWYRLTKEERLAVDAPSGTDALGALALSLNCWHEGESIYVAVMQLTSYVDESGTGSHRRIMLGGLAARSSRWFDFAAHWRKILRRANIAFSHLVDMENGKPPFEGWDKPRTGRFVDKARRAILKHCDFGQTVAIDLTVHQTDYRAQLSDRVHKDSAYGLCARAMIEGIALVAIERFGRGIRVNFVFENNEHYGDALRIFNDCKAHLDNISACLGTITPGEKVEFGGLQAADLIASIGRRYEEQTVFRTVDLTAASRREFEEGCPIYHVPLGEDHLPGYCKQAEEIATEKRVAKRDRGFKAWQARKYPAS